VSASQRRLGDRIRVAPGDSDRYPRPWIGRLDRRVSPERDQRTTIE
jgi:hypothetical protein